MDRLILLSQGGGDEKVLAFMISLDWLDPNLARAKGLVLGLGPHTTVSSHLLIVQVKIKVI